MHGLIPWAIPVFYALLIAREADVALGLRYMIAMGGWRDRRYLGTEESRRTTIRYCN